MKKTEFFTVGQEIEVPGDFQHLDSWYTAKILETQCLTYLNKQKKTKLVIEYEKLTNPNSSTPLRETIEVKKVRPKPPEITQNVYQINQLVDALFANGWWKGKITGVFKGLRYMVLLDSSNLKHREIPVKIENLRIHRDWIDGEWVTPSFQDLQDINTTGNRGNARKTDQAHAPQVGSTSSIATANIPDTRKRKIRESCAKINTESSSPLYKKQATEVSHTETAQCPEEEESSQKKHEAMVFSSPPDVLSYPQPNSPPPPNEEKELYDLLGDQVQCSQMNLDSQSSTGIANRSTSDEIKQLKEAVGKQTPTSLDITGGQSEKSPLKAPVQEAPTMDLVPHSGRAVPMTLGEASSQGVHAIGNSPTILPNRQEEASPGMKDEFLTAIDISLRSSEGVTDHLSPYFHQGSISPPHISTDRLLESKLITMREPPLKNCELQKSSYLIKCSMNNGEREKENRKVLFTKSSLWSEIESMEELCELPQNPHFRPLEYTNEYLREGVAIGYMVTFAGLVNWTKRAPLDAPSSVFEENLAALEYLEDAGFNVQCVRTKIKNLLRIKENHVQNDESLKQYKEKIAKERLEEEGFEVELGELDGRISEFEKVVSQMKKKRESVEVEKKAKGFMIAGIERKVCEIEGMTQDIENEFRNSAATGW